MCPCFTGKVRALFFTGTEFDWQISFACPNIIHRCKDLFLSTTVTSTVTIFVYPVFHWQMSFASPGPLTRRRGQASRQVAVARLLQSRSNTAEIGRCRMAAVTITWCCCAAPAESSALTSAHLQICHDDAMHQRLVYHDFGCLQVIE